MAACSATSRKWMFLIHHVFLPPKLPQEDDTHGRLQKHLAQQALETLRTFRTAYDASGLEKQASAVDAAIGAVSNLLGVHNFSSTVGDATINAEKLEQVLKSLSQTSSLHPVAIHVAAQNAGLLVYRHEDSIVLEIFELSAQNQPVIGTQGRLVRKFPGVAIQIPIAKLEPCLIKTIACALDRMSGQAVHEAIPTTSKAGRAHEEIRDTAHPKVVTELLTAFLLSVGEAVEVKSVHKYTRDEVMWKNCKIPWRRSPLWLLIKVSIQLIFLRSGLESQDGLNLYKHFIVIFACHIRSKAIAPLRVDPVCSEWCDIVYAMSAKISRRILKLRSPLPQPIRDIVADDVLQQTWDGIRRSEAHKSQIHVESLQSLVFANDTNTKLPKLEEFIDSISMRTGETIEENFTPHCPLPVFDSIAKWSKWGNTGSLIGAWCDHRLSNLEPRLDSMFRQVPFDATTSCTSLWREMETYRSMVTNHCGENPEAISLMVLGVMELWVACDLLACKACPLLLDYDPDIDIRRLQPLLLPFRPQMERLAVLEEYLEKRREKGIHKHIWVSFGKEDTFAVRYFGQSEEHKALRRRIEESAREIRNRKIMEFQSQMNRYASLMNQVNTTDCTEQSEMRNGLEHRFHSSNLCRRCITEKEAICMQIEIHEWPLPKVTWDLKTVVFELNAPRWFSVWREATNLVRFKLLQCSYDLDDPRSQDQRFKLQSDVHLSKYFDTCLPNGSAPNFGLLSTVKPHMRTHYNSKKLSSLVKVEEVLFDNALQYQYFDFNKDCTAGRLSSEKGMTELTESMTYRLPRTSRAVAQFIFRPPISADGLESNVVLSSQSECPTHLSLTEYKALCTIPQGLRIQWQNILVQVAAPCVDFKKEEAAKVVLQCMYQAGPDGGKRWSRHAHHLPATREDFGAKMLKCLHKAMTRIEENWRCVDELACYISIARRILSLSTSDGLKLDVLAYLSKARAIGLSWVNTLKERVDSTADDEKCRFRSRVAHAALICVDTFNFQDTLSNGQDILGLALRNTADMSNFISCCITVQECYAPKSDNPNPILYWRWQQLCFRAYPILYHAMVHLLDGALDNAIRRSWVTFRPTGAGWAASASPGCQNGAWLTRKSASAGGKDLTVHYCLVTGELRVNGLPLNRLPTEYENQPMYRTLFGSSVLEVMPGDVPGMVFSGKKRYANHEVHFGLSRSLGEHCVLLVRAVKDNWEGEVIDPKVLEGFPHRLVSDYVHWYDISSNTVEFRPREEPWIASNENWRLGVGEDGMWQLTNRNDRVLVFPYLLNTQSETASRMEHIFSPLVTSANLELVYRPSSSLLEIDLPKLKLGFHIEKGSSLIQSRQFRGMSVDPDQDIGALIGFDNKLVLNGNSQDKRRKVILLEGPIRYAFEDSHTRVTVSREVASLSHAYNVDTRLGRLEDNGSLESKLLLCYLHALTSFCLPDPMTKRTGTEQALDILNSAAVKSFNWFNSQCTEMLTKIATLTPPRLYYPRHLKVMQTVTWDDHLGFLAQHNGFLRAVTSLFNAAGSRAFYYKDRYIDPPDFKNTTLELVSRDGIRTAAFRVSQYGAERHTTEKDCRYSSRDTDQGSDKAHSAFSMADYVVNCRGALPKAMPANLKQHIWNYLADAAGMSVLGATHCLGSEDAPQYDAHWLLDSHNLILGKNLVLYHELLSGRRDDMKRFDVAIWLSTLAFAKNADMSVIQLLAACANEPTIALIQPPLGIDNFIPSCGHVFRKNKLLSDLENNAYLQVSQCPEYKASRGKGYYEDEKARNRYNSRRRQALNPLLECVSQAWPCAKPSLARHSRRGEWETYVKTSEAVHIVRKLTVPWFHNHQLEGYLSRIVDLLPGSGSVSAAALLAVKGSASQTLSRNGPRSGHISGNEIFLCPYPDPHSLASAAAQPLSAEHTHVSEQGKSDQSSLLSNLLHRLDLMAQAAFEKDYVVSLRQSVSCLTTRRCENVHIPTNPVEIFDTYLGACKERSNEIYAAIRAALNGHMSSLFTTNLFPEEPSHSISERCFSTHWPRVSPSFLLQGLARENRTRISPGWKECIVNYGVALVEQQRAERMLAAARRGDTAALRSEVLNPGHENWDPMEYPDSLLLEVESGITIRRVQEEIAARMRSPPDGTNAVMQLNMGEGKSSVIVPIVASALADGKSLVRVFVAKPQSKQMLEMLTSKLGGLIDRVVFQMPTSRDLRVEESEARSMREMLEECREVGGVLLLQPEHALSLQQMGTEFASDPERKAAAEVLNLNRHLLHRAARDIVDESDENFSVKFELVYTMGTQQPVDHSPQRWQTVQEVLDLVCDVAPEVQQEFPDAIEIHNTPSPGSFPRTRILEPEAMQRVLDELVTRICDAGMAGFPIPRQAPAVRDAVRTYITKADLSEEEIRRVEGPTGFWAQSVRPTLALLRGLVACNILRFAFMQKRWRVNYGLAPDRRPPLRVAVPYRAKDQPSARSEFSHPDVVIILTCLTYYYSGLTDDNLFLAFDQLFQSDQAEIEYGRWVRGNMEIPGKFRTLAGVNTEDKDQCTNDIFPHLRLSKAVIDYFLSHVVYPKEMKEFPSKLSSSGWDLGEKKVHPTTGFSGTNDSRRLLPLGIEQLDLDEQKHTNALVMSYLLQPETSVIDIPLRGLAQASDADALLDLVTGLQPPVRVILDVGAQVLELDNLGVARQWLKRVTNDQTQAALFFDDNDELSVVDRNGHIERLQTSSFASQMDACLIFLDEAHTRGTDLKLPTNYRAAVTLGANQTKDGLMQGCMRMRKLGHGQSVVFCVPQEIKMKIRELLPEDRNYDGIQVPDILIWSIRETWNSLQRGVQLWAAQGRRHQKHQRLWNEFTDGERVLNTDQAREFLEDEAQTILQRYRPEAPSKMEALAQNSNPRATPNLILGRLREFGVSRCDATLHEEQERELAPEIETERQTELPPPIVPAPHSVHPDVTTFATEGTIVQNSKAYVRAFKSLSRTRAGREFEVAQISRMIAPTLLVTADFARTVRLPDEKGMFQDSYLRSVQWVLVSRQKAEEPTMLILSPYEANKLILAIAKAKKTTLYLYSSRVNPAYPSLDDLGLFPFPKEHNEPIPQHLRVALNLFAGQLYFNDFNMYVSTCRFLGLSWEKAKEDEVLDSDGFIIKDSEGKVGGGSGFTRSPVKFFLDLTLMRRDTQAITKTHIGDMLDNRPLSKGLFD